MSGVANLAVICQGLAQMPLLAAAGRMRKKHFWPCLRSPTDVDHEGRNCLKVIVLSLIALVTAISLEPVSEPRSNGQFLREKIGSPP
jgi:hypothetical protein